MSLHIARRPDWLCAVDDAPWPCPTAQRQLIAEYDGARVSLHLYLAATFVEAAGQLGDVPANDLYVRFLGWAP